MGEKGTTLIELLIAFALIAVVMSSLMTVYFLAHNAWQMQVEVTDSQYMARSSLQWVINDIRQAKTTTLENNNLVIMKHNNEKVVYKVDAKEQLQRNNVPVAENITAVDYIIYPELVEIKITATINEKAYILASGATPRK